MKKSLVVLAATLSISSAFAQTAPSAASASMQAAPAAAASGAAAHQQRVEQRIAYLHSTLKITPAQESQWNTFADVMRSNAASMAQLYEQREANQQGSALDDMKQYAQISQAHADGMQKLVAAFEPLYNSFSPDQKALADKTFHQHGQPGHNERKRKGARHGARSAAPASETGGK